MGVYFYPPSVENLIMQLGKLPGVGPKTAQRLAFHLLNAPEEDALGLAEAIGDAREKVRRCAVCGNLSDTEVCPLCRDQSRDRSLLCVVEQPKDVMTLEKTREYRGLYHVLHGAISPMAGVGPKDLTIDLLMKRLAGGEIKEVIMTTNPNVEGEATALYLARQIKPYHIKVTRIARGVPVGGDLEYADEATLARALAGRKEL